MNLKCKFLRQNNTNYIYLLTYLLTLSIQQRTYWEVNRFTASQKFRRILCNPMIHYRIRMLSPTAPILSQINQGHASTSNLMQFDFNVISQLRMVSRLICFHQNSPPKPCISLYSQNACHMPRQSHFWFCHPNEICWGEQIVQWILHS
jgi:hypothetical protein